MVTASIVVHKTPAFLLEKAIKCLLSSKVTTIYIIDNSPSDDLKKVIDNLPRTEYYHVKNNGFGAGHNIAIQKSMESGADYHLIMNADVWWKDDVIRTLTNYLDNNPEVGMVSPKTYYPDGRLQHTCRRLPTPWDMFIRILMPSNFFKRRRRAYLMADYNHNKAINCPYLLGSFMLFRNKALKDIGIFDERFFMYPEDIDITRRIHEKWKTIYFPEVSIIHEHQQASKKSPRMFWVHLSNMIKYFNKWGWIFDPQRKLFNSEIK